MQLLERFDNFLKNPHKQIKGQGIKKKCLGVQKKFIWVE